MPLASLKTPIALFVFFAVALILLHIGEGYKRRWRPLWLTLTPPLVYCAIFFLALRNQLDMFPDHATYQYFLFKRVFVYSSIRKVDLGNNQRGKLVLTITLEHSDPFEVNCQTFAFVPSQFPAALHVLHQRTPQAKWNEMALRWERGDTTE